MDPVGPWSAYASYNRMSGVQTGAASGDIHTQLIQSVTPPTTTAQIIPSSFIPSTPVGYENVFNPLPHAGSKPPVHYVPQAAQHRQPLTQTQPGTVSSKQSTEAEYQGQNYFEQNGVAWQQSSPFGVLPHESVAPSTTVTKTTIYDNFNAQGLNHLNTQMTASNPKNTIPCVQTTDGAKSSSQPNSTTFFQVPPVTYSNSDPTNSTKTYVSSDASNLQQSCIVSSPPNISSSKDYNLPQLSNPTNFVTSSARPLEKPFAAHSNKQPIGHVQTKAQTKIYPDLNNQADRTRPSQHDENQTQSSPISYCTDASGDLNYTNNNNVKRTQFQSSSYRHYQQGNNTETEFQRTKSIDYHNSNGSEYGVVPTRASPLQTHSQASPLGHSHSPVYPMYNSPMNSSSPQQASSNLVAPSSPLDATVSRSNSQSGNAVHPSVITRALNCDKKFPDHYDRTVQQQPQDCWEGQAQQQQQRKYQPHSAISSSYASGNNLDMSSRVSEHCQQRTVNSQGQQPYFSNNPTQLPLQDLSSCKGDPISLVKSLPQQQSCQMQQLNNIHKPEPRITSKRRKSNEKLQHSEIPQGTTISEYFAGRVPPPAHSSASTQQPNGTYFDFDRWNLTSASSKMFGTPGVHQQHQGILVNHPQGHRPPPTLPYFAPFHAPPPPSEYPQSVELASSTCNEQPAQQNPSTQLGEPVVEPKVVVPNIEEELDYLSKGLAKKTTTITQTTTTVPVVRPPAIVNQCSSSDRTSGSAGFMYSYLRFLQGDRDPSPPFAPKARKHTWSRSKIVEPTITQTNGAITTPTPPILATRLSQGDPQDDPRYFPLPKERKKNHFDSDEDGFDSESDLFTKKTSPNKNNFLKKNNFKRGKGKVQKTVHRKPPRKVFHAKKEKVYNANIVSVNFPRRESSRRAAKEKTNLRKMIAEEELDYLDYMESDSDPAWSPKNNDEDSIIAVVMKKGRKGGKRKSPCNLITAAAQGAGINDLDGYNSDGTGNSKKLNALGIIQVQKQIVNTLENNIAAVSPIQTTISTNAPSVSFKDGDFLVLKTELAQEWPPLWRVDGKALLQRYEPFEQDGETLYQNIPTYTAWCPDNANQFIRAPVNFKVQTPSEVIIELLRKHMLSTIELAVIEKSMEDSMAYQDHFEVYIQTLISQALDSNFLTEIFQEQDEYFLSNVKTIDDITNKQKQKLILVLKWPKPILIAINTWPYFNTINELTIPDGSIKPCAGCLVPGISVRVLMFGQSYNIATLDNCPPPPHSNEKDFFMCRTCAKHVELLNKITHQKYRMYVQCAKKVSQQRTLDPKKDTTCVLNELLADDDWLIKLFDEVCRSWAEVDSFEHKSKINKCGDSINNKTV